MQNERGKEWLVKERERKSAKLLKHNRERAIREKRGHGYGRISY